MAAREGVSPRLRTVSGDPGISLGSPDHKVWSGETRSPFKEIRNMMIVSNTTSQTAKIVWVGIDLSKKTLDAAIWHGNTKYSWRKFDNNPRSFSTIVDWATKFAIDGSELRFCMESTGDYGTLLALYLLELGYYVSVENPARIKHFGIQKGVLTKTDKADAKVIAWFATDNSPKACPLKDPLTRELLRLHRRRLQLTEMIASEKCRRECPTVIGAECMDSIKVVLKALRAELRRIEEKLRELIDSNEKLKEKSELILSIPGLGWASVFVILIEMPDIEDVAHAPSYAAAAGVQPTAKRSGERQPESSPMSRAGRRIVRRSLYMPSIHASWKIPELEMLYTRLVGKGKRRMQARVACLRKLLMIVYGVLRNKKKFATRYPQSDTTT